MPPKASSFCTGRPLHQPNTPPPAIMQPSSCLHPEPDLRMRGKASLKRLMRRETCTQSLMAKLLGTHAAQHTMPLNFLPDHKLLGKEQNSGKTRGSCSDLFLSHLRANRSSMLGAEGSNMVKFLPHRFAVNDWHFCLEFAGQMPWHAIIMRAFRLLNMHIHHVESAKITNAHQSFTHRHDRFLFDGADVGRDTSPTSDFAQAPCSERSPTTRRC